MNATKRKFNALLNGMGNKSTTSLVSMKNESRTDLSIADETESQKRRRTSASTSKDNSKADAAASLLKPTAVARSSAAALQHKKSASLATSTITNQDTPKYAPWDREAFLKRLKSFSNLTDWTPKPARVNEVEWAKRGWVCQKKERVRCCLCNVEILVKLNKKVVDGKEEPVYIAQNIEDALVDKYVELIIESHDENCLWKKRGCDDSIFKLSLNHAPTTFQLIRERYDELEHRADTLPYLFNLRTPPGFDIETIISYLPKDFFTIRNKSVEIGDSPGKINKVALTMAIFGWQGHKHERLGPQVGSVSCQACFRVLGLWLFRSKEVNEAGEEVVGAAVSCLDVVKEHREYCPWQNPESQTGAASSTAMAGWEVVLRVLKNEYYLRTKGEPISPKITNKATPQREGTPAIEEEEDGADAKSIREENDKKRWARLRRVKSLFNTKSGKKITQGDSAKDKAGI